MVKRIPQPEIARDRWGRPVLDGKAFERASTRAGRLDDKGPLISWKAGRVLDAIRADMSLLTFPRDTALERIESLDRAAATYGTTVHALVEAWTYGEPEPEEATADHIADARAVMGTLDELGMTILAAEVFVVNVELEVAGTLDLLLQDSEGGVCIGDLKTQNKADGWRFKGLSWASQTAVYANARPLNAAGEIVDWPAFGLPEPAKDEALILALHRQHAQVTPVVVDIGWGLECARLGGVVQRLRGEKSTLRVL